jgi:hypothetical protein
MNYEEQWAAFVRYAGDTDFPKNPAGLGNKEEFIMAMDILSKISKSELEQVAFISRQKYQLDFASDIGAARRAGEKKTAISIAKEAFSMGFTIDQIKRLTKLTEEEVLKIQKSMS